ncbi:hypothetical protein LguiB_004344 [Lonicera macranthoides]
MAAEAAGLTILEKVVEKLLDPIWRQFSYLFCYNSNIKNLTNGVKDLQIKRDNVKKLVDAAERNLKTIGADVRAWQKKVKAIEIEANEVDEHAKNVKNGCLNGWGPRGLKNRYWLSRKAVKQNVDVVKLQEEGKGYNTQLSYDASPAGLVAPTSSVGHEVFQSRISMMEEVIQTLKNDKINTIGICGAGGIGKTRMAKEILESETVYKLFDEVAMAVVSQALEFSRIQGEIANMLGLQLDKEDSNYTRALKLRERLMQDKRTLVILDDVWKQLDLAEVGIPVQGEGRCKLLLTTRDEHVCSTMRTQKVFKVQLLSDQEAWNLFKDKAGDCVDANDIHSIAKDVLNECGRLPLAIVTVGSALNGAAKYAWDDALQQLRTSTAKDIEGMDAYVYSRLKLSYDYLNQERHSTQEKHSNGIQRLFLLCCLFREDYDIPIEYLVRYAVGLGLFEDIQDLAATRNRVQALADRLKNCYLLLDSDNEGHVKMHDVVRDFGLAFATEGEHVYFVKHGTGLQEWPENSQTSTAISISEEGLNLPAHLECPRLKLLELSAKGSIEVSMDYSGGMEELRVVGLRNKCIRAAQMLVEAPPKANQFFTNVRSLCLEYCRFGSPIGFIVRLQKLIILSFYASKIDVLPNEIAQLSNLKLLDLRCKKLGLIPSGVLSCLGKLEALYMGNYFYKNSSEECGHGASVTELNKLAHMRTLQICISDPDLLLELQDVRLKELLRFNISLYKSNYEFIGDSGYEFPNELRLTGFSNSVPFEAKTKALTSRIEDLVIKRTEGLVSIASESDEDSFLKLKTINIYDCGHLKEMCNGLLPAQSFGRLERVTLSNLPQMEYLWRGPIEPPCLINLKYISLYNCEAIKSLFPQSVVKCLMQLLELIVEDCEKLEGIVSDEERAEYENVAKTIEFPKLNRLELSNLPRLKSFSTAISDDIHRSESDNHDVIIQPLLNQVLLPSMETLSLENSDVVKIVGDQIHPGSLCKLKDLFLFSCHKLPYVAAFAAIKSLPSLQTLRVYYCLSVETLFDFEELEFSEEHAAEVTMLGQLDSIELRVLHELRCLWNKVPKGIQVFQKLTKLSVFQCRKVRFLFSPSVVRMLMNLQKLKLGHCKIMEVVIQKEEEECCSEIENTDKIVFPHLLSLTLRNLENLTAFCEGNHDIEFPLLEKVFIFDKCPKMNNFCSGSLTTPKLESAYPLDRIQLLKIQWSPGC